MLPSITGLDFATKLNRWQFLIQLALAMTINKAQGQTIKHVGIDLYKPMFTYGQLYVAFSYSTLSNHIKVLLNHNSPEKQTPNVVYTEILL